ncbi:MAG TPA: ImmA/IrrE family metallo-endopeptidase [Symbiobacteriaceae bacterium]
MSQSRAEQEAGRVLQQARTEYSALGEPWDNYRVDVDLVGSLLFGLGVQLVPDLRAGAREYAGFLDAESRLIAVEEHHHEHRRRFSVAHEIGHFVLHYLPEPGEGLFRCTQGDMEVGAAVSGEGARLVHLRQESEANLFAGALLMPESAVRAMATATRGRVDRLATHFGVSPQAMSIRLVRLGIKPH